MGQLWMDESEIKMLDPSCETRGNCTRSLRTSFYDKGRVPAGPGLHRYHPPLLRKKTVKQLLMMERLDREEIGVVNNTLGLRRQGPWTPVIRDKMPPVQMTLFQWQIKQEEQKVAGMPAELLGMQDADGDTLLHITVAQGKRALAYALALKMAQRGVLDLKEHNEQTALQIAVATNNHLIVQDLLTHGANVNTRDLWGRSPMHVCAQKGHVFSLQAIWKTAQQTQVDIEMYNYDGLTALHTATMSHNNVVKELWALHSPCMERKREAQQRCQMYTNSVKILLLMGATIGTKDLKSGRTCLHMASQEGNIELLNIFLDRPSSVRVINATDFNGNTALHMVSALQNSRSQAAAVKLLMARGANPNIKNLENELPCQLVAKGPSGEKVRQLLNGKHFPK